MDIHPEPELMIIGDSLAQGCRLLSVAKENWSFVSPDYKPSGQLRYRKADQGVRTDTRSALSAFIAIKKLRNIVRDNLKVPSGVGVYAVLASEILHLMGMPHERGELLNHFRDHRRAAKSRKERSVPKHIAGRAL